MLYVTDKMIQLSGVVIPGQVKKIEITQAATIDEVQDDNNVTLGYQPTGYELAKISVEITLEPTQEQTFLEQLATIQLLFRPVGQTEPKVLELVNSQAAAHNITQVYFKQISSSKKTESSYGTATLEFWEYVPMKVSTKKASSSTGSGSASGSSEQKTTQSSADGITAEYQEYLNTQRGKAPQSDGITAECYSSTTDRCNYAVIELDKQLIGSVELSDMMHAEVRLGYDDDFDTIVSGYVQLDRSGGGKVHVLDDTILLMRTRITATFVDSRPQDIIRYGLERAGVTNYQLADAYHPACVSMPVHNASVLDLIALVNKKWDIDADYYFVNGCFHWDTGTDQEDIYILEEGKNILAYTEFCNEREVKTIGIPWIHQGELVEIHHSRYSGQVRVTATKVKRDEKGQVRMFLTF